MDFAFFAIAFNIKKMCSKIAKQVKNGGNTPQNGLFLTVCRIYRMSTEYFGIILKNQSPEKYPNLNLLKKRLRRKTLITTQPHCIMDIRDYFTRILREPSASTTM